MGVQEAGQDWRGPAALSDAPEIARLASALEREAETGFEVERPYRETGLWWLTLRIDGADLEVSWQASAGFGVHTLSPGFGGKPDEFYADPERCARRLLQIAARRRTGAAGHALTLRDMRQLCGVSQAELAAMLGTDQGHVSRLERKADLKASVLRAFVQALGGELEVRVRFPDFTAPLATPLAQTERLPLALAP